MTMFFAWRRKRRAQKDVKERLRFAMHVLHTREDVLRTDTAERLKAAIRQARAVIGGAGDIEALASVSRELDREIGICWPSRKFASFRENFEVIVVAVAVAMACRAYFVQPFQIPTGSMQPTLYGIHCWNAERTVLDHYPLNLAKWLVFGEWYRDVRATESGFASPPCEAPPKYPAHLYIDIAGRHYRVPRSARILVRPGQWVEAGERIWAGIEHKGDHVFVDKVSWNFRRPRRGEIMVFKTDGIEGLPAGTYYIKRMVGLPGENVTIKPPDIEVDGRVVREPEGIRRIAAREPNYAGYMMAPGIPFAERHAILVRPDDVAHLGPDEYLALGDNTGNSRDSRYWGPVRRANLVGPALLVYWPGSRRWGRPD